MARSKKIISRLTYPSNLDFSIFPTTRLRNHGLYWLDQLIYWSLISEDEDCYLRSIDISDFLGSDYAKAKKILIKEGVMISNNLSDYRGLCEHYELAPEYRAAEKWHFAFYTGDKFGKRLAKLKADKLKLKLKSVSEKTKEICIQPEELNERQEVYDWVTVESMSKVTLGSGYHNEAQKQETDRQIKYWEDCGTMVSIGGYEPYISPLSGRLYYLGCSFAEPSRKHILINGNKTGEIDITCAQPYFCSSLYDNFDQKHQAEKEEFLRFIKNEDFYEGLNKIAGSPYVIHSQMGEAEYKEARKQIKKGAYTSILFGSERNLNMPMAKALKSRFPILYGLIKSIKKNNPNPPVKKGEKKKKGNTFFAIKLQKLEADITFSVVAILKSKGIHCLTIHDSIRVELEHLNLVHELYYAECFKRVGAAPVLHSDQTKRLAA